MPLALRLVIDRCLDKDPSKRYQRASDVREALEAIEANRSWPIVWRLLIKRRRRALQIAAGITLHILALAILSVNGLRRFSSAATPHVERLRCCRSPTMKATAPKRSSRQA